MSCVRRLSAASAAVACASVALLAPAAGHAQAGEWESCAPLSVTTWSGIPYRVTGLEARQVTCDFAAGIVRGFYSQEIGSSGAAEVEGFGCAYGSGGSRVLCVLKSGNSYSGPQRVRWRQRTPAGVDPGSVVACRSFTVFEGHSSYSGDYAFWASFVRRSAAISCRMTRKLLEAAYDRGPLHVIRTVYPHSNGHRAGRPTYWLPGGWRCGNGAGGASCWNAQKPRLNAIPVEGLAHGLAVSANVRIRR